MKVHIWGGISREGPTDLLIFIGIMDAEFYVGNILRDTYLPSAKRLYPDPEVQGEPLMWADNDPKHTAKLSQAFCKVRITCTVYIYDIFN